MDMVEKVARAMEDAELGYSMDLVRLVDGVSTYSLKYSDGETLEFNYTDDAYDHVRNKKRLTQARAAIEAMREPTEAMLEAGRLARMNVQGGYGGPGPWEAMIDAALSSKGGE